MGGNLKVGIAVVEKKQCPRGNHIERPIESGRAEQEVPYDAGNVRSVVDSLTGICGLISTMAIEASHYCNSGADRQRRRGQHARTHLLRALFMVMMCANAAHGGALKCKAERRRCSHSLQAKEEGGGGGGGMALPCSR